MPRRRRKRRRTRKKTFRRRRRRRRRRKMTFSKRIQPRFQRRKLIYVDNILSPDPGVGSAVSHVYRLNSLFDPDFTGAGHQPMGFDQMASLYNTYRVYSVSFRVTFRNTNANRAIVGLMVSQDSFLPISVNQNQELPRNRWRVLDAQDATGNSKNETTINYSLKPWRFMNIRYKEDIYQAPTGSNPAEQSFMHIWIGPTSLSVNLAGINLTVRISFLAEFFDPILLGQS